MADELYRKLNRRDLLKAGAALAVASPLLAACGGDDGEGPDTDTDTDTGAADGGEETPSFTEVPDDFGVAEGVPPVDRNRTLFLRWGGQEGRFVDHELWNGYAVGANHQNGLGVFYEPLAFYSAFADEEIMWLAEDYEFNDDSTELRITVRSGINWSDGEPFNAEDVAYTLNTARDYGAAVRWGTDVEQFVEEAVAESDTEVVVTFLGPAPRFFFFMTYKYDIGLYMVPQHIYEGEDWETFTCLDIENDIPVTTGPWQLRFTSPDQKIIDRRDSWWAVDQGLVDALPDVERIVYLPFGNETQVAQQLITNAIDCSLDLRPLTIARVMEDNPSITTHTGTEPPYGYVDWWPTALFVNHEVEPWNDVDIRWAVSKYLNREQIIEVGYNGAGSSWPLPLPSYPGLEPFIEEVSDLLEEYDTLEYNVEEADATFEEKGYTKNGQGIWELNGQPLELEVMGITVFNDIGPIIVEQLRQGGIDATYTQPPNRNDRFNQGDYTGCLSGHGGSVSGDPYFTMRLFQSQSEAATATGTHQVNFTRWENSEYDALVDEMAETPRDDQEELLRIWREAMEIWIPELPNIQIQEWYHRIPMNQTYWTGWPTEENPYVNGAFWHLTFQLVLNNLSAAQ